MHVCVSSIKYICGYVWLDDFKLLCAFFYMCCMLYACYVMYVLFNV